MKRNFIIIFILTTLISCSNDKINIVECGKTISLEPIDTLYSDHLFTCPSHFDVFDGHFVFFRQLRAAAVFLRVSDFKETGSYGRRGHASNEYIAPYFAGLKDNTMYIYDVTTTRLSSVNITFEQDTVLVHNGKYVTKPSDNTNLLHAGVVLDNGIFIYNTLFDPNYYLAYSDTLLNNIHNFPIPFTELIGYKDNDFQGRLSSHKNVAVFYSHRCSSISLFKFDDSGNLIEEKELNFNLTKFKQKQKKIDFDLDNNGKVSDIKITDKYIYVLHKYPAKENETTSTIFILDHDGNALCKFSCADNSASLAIDDDDKTLYILTFSGYLTILKYELPGHY